MRLRESFILLHILILETHNLQEILLMQLLMHIQLLLLIYIGMF